MIGCKSCAHDPDPVNGVTYLVCTKGDECRERLALAVLDRIGDEAAEALRDGRAAVVPVEPTYGQDLMSWAGAMVLPADPNVTGRAGEVACRVYRAMLAAGRLDRGGA